MKPAYLITKASGATVLLFDRQRAHGLAAHYGWSVRELTPAEAKQHCVATLEKSKAAR